MKIGELKNVIGPLKDNDEVYVSAVFTQNREVLSRGVIQGEQDIYGNLNLKIVIRDVNKKVLDYSLKTPGIDFDTKT